MGAGDGALLDALAARRAGCRSGSSATRTGRTSARPSSRDLDGPFAAIVFWHSLEHLRDAGAELERGRRGCSRPAASIVVAMPNPASLQARAFGDRWLALDLPRHLVHVPAPALLARLRELGLEPTRVSYLRGGQVVFGWLHGIVGQLPSPPRPLRRDPQARGPARRRSRRRSGASRSPPAALALPVAAACALVEAGLRRGGTVYVEARRG